MKKVTLSIILITCPLTAMEMPQLKCSKTNQDSSKIENIVQQLSPRTTSFNEYEEKEKIKKHLNNQETKDLEYLLKNNSWLRIKLYAHMHTINNQKREGSPSERVLRLCAFEGYELGQEDSYEKLPQNLRAFFSLFKSWPHKEKDTAILRGIANYQPVKVTEEVTLNPLKKKKEFEAITPENYERLLQLFEKLGYSLNEPQKSPALQKNVEKLASSFEKLGYFKKINAQSNPNKNEHV